MYLLQSGYVKKVKNRSKFVKLVNIQWSKLTEVIINCLQYSFCQKKKKSFYFILNFLALFYSTKMPCWTKSLTHGSPSRMISEIFILIHMHTRKNVHRKYWGRKCLQGFLFAVYPIWFNDYSIPYLYKSLQYTLFGLWFNL